MLLHRQGFLCCGCGVSSAVAARAGGGASSSWPTKKPAEDDDESSSSSTSSSSTTPTPLPTAKQLSWAQVEAMTGGFTSAIVGEGGFSTVYLARLAGSLAAVKVHRNSSSSERLQRAFRQELAALLRVRHHPHIVRLLGFCDQGGVLVLEFAPNGNLHDRLHTITVANDDGSNSKSTMPWARRVRVAVQVARALEYLHHELQVVHGDVKASNVLLDADMGARLCDFGSARAGFSVAALTTTMTRPPRAVQGSPGYVDPHYLRSGLLTRKSDVYSFGVLLLELVTGLLPFCAKEGRLLASTNRHKLGAVDRRLGCRYDPDEAAAMVALAAACVGDNPSLRPSMADVVRTLQHNAQSSVAATVPVPVRSRSHAAAAAATN